MRIHTTACRFNWLSGTVHRFDDSGRWAFASYGFYLSYLHFSLVDCRCFMAWAVVQPIPQARALVTNDPYRYVRHPLYLAEFLIVFGLGLGFKQPWSSVVTLLFLPAQLPRMNFEEEVLTKAFPNYGDYARRTARLIPFIY